MSDAVVHNSSNLDIVQNNIYLPELKQGGDLLLILWEEYFLGPPSSVSSVFS